MANNPTDKSNDTGEGLEARIAARAYTLYLKEGRPHGRALQHWLAAEAELRTPTAEPAPVMKDHARRETRKASKPTRLEFVLQEYQ